jgi:hypothetical protein
MKLPLLQSRRLAQKISQFVAGLSIATGLMSLSVPAQAAQKGVALPNGVYLYGQATQPDQLGQAYFVFEVRQGKLLGALYMPRSSFDCTYGAIQGDKLALTVIDSYNRSENPYAIALDQTPVAGNGTVVNLEGFQKLPHVSNNDRRILEMCKTHYQNRVWK